MLGRMVTDIWFVVQHLSSLFSVKTAGAEQLSPQSLMWGFPPALSPHIWLWAENCAFG